MTEAEAQMILIGPTFEDRVFAHVRKALQQKTLIHLHRGKFERDFGMNVTVMIIIVKDGEPNVTPADT